jgi:hypothetical protein
MRDRIMLYTLALALGLSSAALAWAQDKTPRDAKNSSSVQGEGTTVEYSNAMRRLLDAAQRLRDAIHAMAEQKPGPAVNQAIRQTNEALLETQQAMLDLPFDLRAASGSAPEWTKSMDRLKQAAQQLREATQAMAQQKAGTGRNAAMRQANRALLETQQAMVDLLPDVNSRGSTSGSNTPGSKH